MKKKLISYRENERLESTAQRILGVSRQVAVHLEELGRGKEEYIFRQSAYRHLVVLDVSDPAIGGVVLGYPGTLFNRN